MFMRINRGSFKPLLLALAIALTAHGSISAGQVVLTSGDLPYTASDYDTITFANDTTVSETNGIFLDFSQDVFINGEGKAIQFGNNGGDNAYGIRLYGSGTHGCRIANLTVFRNEGVNAAAGRRNDCIRMTGCNDIVFDSVNLIIDGHNAQCVTVTSPCYDILFNYGTWTSNSRSFTDRHAYDGAVAIMGDAGTGSDYAYKLNKITITNGPAQGVRLKGLCIVDSCDFTLDHVNDDPGGSNANQYAILFRQVSAGSVIRNTTITSGKNRGGCRGILVENSVGTPEDYVLVHDNTLDLHCGPDDENPGGVLRSIRLRTLDGHDLSYIKVYDNTITTTVDDDAGTTHIGNKAGGIQCSAWDTESLNGHIYFYNNKVYSRSLSVGTYARAAEFMNDIAGGNDIAWYNNEFYSCNTIMLLQDDYNADGCIDGLFYDNTYGFMDITAATGNDSLVLSDQKTWQIGYPGKTSTGNVSVDDRYVNGASDSDVDFPVTGSGNITMKRTLRVYVRGQNSLPVHGASVTVTNGDGASVLTGTTTNGGLVKGVVSYQRATSSQAEPTDFGPFNIAASLSGDNVQQGGFVVSSLPAGGTDTLTLSQTVGDGTWDDPEQPEDSDTIPPEAPFLEVGP